MPSPAQITQHNGSQLFDIRNLNPRPLKGPLSGPGRLMPSVFDLDFQYNGSCKPALAGGGVYAVFYKDELLYIGIFTGADRQPFSSNVALKRFTHHLQALTLRGHGIWFADNANGLKGIATLHSTTYSKCPLVGQLSPVLKGIGTGTVQTFVPMVKFASQNWNNFSCLTSGSQLVLEDFHFVYGRVDATWVTPGNPIIYQNVKNWLGAIEQNLIRSLGPRCNTKHAKAPSGSPNGPIIFRSMLSNLFSSAPSIP